MKQCLGPETFEEALLRFVPAVKDQNLSLVGSTFVFVAAMKKAACTSEAGPVCSKVSAVGIEFAGGRGSIQDLVGCYTGSSAIAELVAE